MIISHFFPDRFMARFERYADGHVFLSNYCTKDADLIYCGSISRIPLALAAKAEFGKPLVCFVWDIPYCWREWTRNEQEIKEHKWRDNRAKRNTQMLRQCDKVLSASKYTQRVLKERYGLSSEQIYFYIDTEEIDAVRIAGDEGYVVQISRYALNKRFDTSIRAVSGTGTKLIFVGTGRHNHLKSLADKLRADVTFHCNIERSKTIEILKRSTMLVSPSIFEGWGITPIEALYCGKPVLLSDLEVFREVYGDNVIYHKRDDIGDMRDKLLQILNDEQLQRKMVDACRPLMADFTIPKFVERWERAIA